MIATILARPPNGIGAQTATWRQLVDIVAQADAEIDPEIRKAAHQRIEALRDEVPVSERRRAAASLAGRTRNIQVVAIFASDEPAIAAPVLARAELSAEDWRALLPLLPPPSRAILRNRRDLPEGVERALASYGSSDFALPASDLGEGAEPVSQIRELVARIEAFRTRGETAIVDDAAVAPKAATAFAFETSIDGTMNWVEGIAREALIGIEIGAAAAPHAAGVDGQAAGAFRRRAPFRNARLSVAGEGAAGGDWLITATPIFHPRNGRFAGYHGSARRPQPDERAAPHPSHLGGGLAPDSLRQLVHELRTPLNAVQGFAEMIDAQILGPAASAYRTRARDIVGQSKRMLEVVDDLDIAARIDGDALDPPTSGTTDLTMIVARIASEMRAGHGDGAIAVTGDSARTMVTVAPVALDRIVRRLISASIGLRGEGETIAVAIEEGRVAIARPIVLAGIAESMMLDPGFGPAGEWPDAPILGLGFTLRLVARLVAGVGARFCVTDDAFMLELPLASPQEASARGGLSVPADLR